jgi:DNA-binding response OmpR family regulator
MTEKLILFADNDPDFLQTRAEFLQNAGYEVLFAHSPGEAEQLLNDCTIHLAILDIRLSDDDDEKDISGELLAEKVEFRNIPKIMLTSYPSPYTTRDSLRQHPPGFHPAIHYLIKEEGPPVLIRAVNDAFAYHVRINWTLVIDWIARDRFSLVNMIEENLEDKLISYRVQEFKDLFCRLFYEYYYVRVERLLWQAEGRVALIVFAQKEGMKPESYVVVCGLNAMMLEEARRFDGFAPVAPGDTGTRLSSFAETTHYAVIAYTFANIDLEKVQTLGDLYRNANAKLFNDALTILFQKTLAEWHQDTLNYVESSLSSLYEQRLQLTDSYLSPAEFEKRLLAIEKRARDYELTIRHTDEEVSFIRGENVLSYPAPIRLLFRSLNTVETLIVDVPGMLTGQNILADGEGHTWLTDFASAGKAPRFWNYVTLETAIRFDWTDSGNFLRLKELEECLVNGDFFNPDIRDWEPEALKPAQAIVMLRRLGKQEIEQSTADYHLGVFYQAARMLLNDSPVSIIHQSELMRLVHIYLAMAMLTQKILVHGSDGDHALPSAVAGITILDRKARLILAGKRSVPLTPREYAVFEYLFEKAGEVCTKEELVNQVNDGGYSKDYAHKLVGEIRKKIEDDPKQPRYLINVPYAGYRLVIDPE